MNTTNRQACYGNLFPDSARGGTKGKVFSLQYVTPVGMMRRRAQPVVDLDAWEECLQCPAFETCYKLSMAKQAMAQTSLAM